MNKIYHGNVGDVYYQIIKSPRNGLMTVCTMQDFDEIDYNQSRFCRNSEDKIHCFESEEMAIENLHKWYKPDEIDIKYRPVDENLIKD